LIHVHTLKIVAVSRNFFFQRRAGIRGSGCARLCQRSSGRLDGSGAPAAGAPVAGATAAGAPGAVDAPGAGTFVRTDGATAALFVAPFKRAGRRRGDGDRFGVGGVCAPNSRPVKNKIRTSVVVFHLVVAVVDFKLAGADFW